MMNLSTQLLILSSVFLSSEANTKSVMFPKQVLDKRDGADMEIHLRGDLPFQEHQSQHAVAPRGRGKEALRAVLMMPSYRSLALIINQSIYDLMRKAELFITM